MSEQPLTGAARLTRAWVSAYTRGVPAESRERRRGEIDSDLWEQSHDDREQGRASAQTSLEITVRLMLGMPADLSWRLEHASPKRSATRLYQGSRAMLQTASRYVMPVLIGLLAAGSLAMAFAIPIDGDIGGLAPRLMYGIVLGVAGLLLAVGLFELKRKPLAASVAIGVGAILVGGLTWWSMLTPAAALIILAWIFLGARQRRSPTTA
jgi:hypothetical protein